jgi:hypothetical protein
MRGLEANTAEQISAGATWGAQGTLHVCCQNVAVAVLAPLSRTANMREKK